MKNKTNNWTTPGMDETNTDISTYSIEENESLLSSGINLENKNRSATFILINQKKPFFKNHARKYIILPIAIAIERYPWIKEKYFFKAVNKEEETIVKHISENSLPMGYFIYVQQGEKVTLPCQIGMMMSDENSTQIVHNILIMEENSELNLLTTCMTTSHIKRGHHIAISEHYVGKGAKLVSTMIHSWGPEVIVNPISGTMVEENGRYENNYISMRPAKSIISNPQTFLNGKNASAKYLTVVLGALGSTVNTGGNVYLNADDTSAELTHRGVCTGGTMYQKGLLIANARCRAHVDCAGMMLTTSNTGFIESIPGLQSHHSEAKMSHEASIGRISPEQVEYLMAKGMDEREAISLLIRGFIGSDIEGLGDELDEQIKTISEIAGHGES